MRELVVLFSMNETLNPLPRSNAPVHSFKGAVADATLWSYRLEPQLLELWLLYHDESV
jgi:hypothetical protein